MADDEEHASSARINGSIVVDQSLERTASMREALRCREKRKRQRERERQLREVTFDPGIMVSYKVPVYILLPLQDVRQYIRTRMSMNGSTHLSVLS